MKKSSNSFPKLSVLVPVYNEEQTIEIILGKLIKLKFVYEIIVVDDCSTDGTLEKLEKIKSKKLKLIFCTKNRGKTAAIAKALKKATGDIIIIQDADLEYDPDEIPMVIKPIADGKADVVYGSRFLVRNAARVLYFSHFIANKFLTFFSNILTNLNMTDIETCYKAFRAPIIKNMSLTSSGFGMEVEITALISKLPLRIYEVPISYYGRTYEEGKKIGIQDGLMALYYIFYYNLIVPHTASGKKYFARTRKEIL
ncbi:glycosyltransferase family 2 protein [Candidatus Riflebacteria bacterium]